MQEHLGFKIGVIPLKAKVTGSINCSWCMKLQLRMNVGSLKMFEHSMLTLILSDSDISYFSYQLVKMFTTISLPLLMNKVTVINLDRH